MSTIEQEAISRTDRTSVGIIDCDVHNATRSREALAEYLPTRWRQYLEQGATMAAHESLTLGACPSPRHVSRLDSVPEVGFPGSDYELMRAQLLDRYNIHRAILHPVVDVVRCPQRGPVGLALARAINDWMLAEWLERDERLWGAISVPIEDPVAGVSEVERLATESRFVKVTLTVMTREGLGHPKYWPLYEAAEAEGLPIALHVGGFSGTSTGTGWPTYYIEHIVGHCMNFPSQVTSLVCGGVFDRFPRLQVLLEEGGLGWLPGLMWRLDRTYRTIGSHAHHALDRPPSEVIRDHFWVSTQPLDVPTKRHELVELFGHLDMSDRIVFATDYPHWNFDDPDRVLPAALLGQEVRENVLYWNARRLFARADA